MFSEHSIHSVISVVAMEVDNVGDIHHSQLFQLQDDLISCFQGFIRVCSSSLFISTEYSLTSFYFMFKWRSKSWVCNVAILSQESVSFKCQSKSCNCAEEISTISSNRAWLISSFLLFKRFMITSWLNEFDWFNCWDNSSSDTFLPTTALKNLVIYSRTYIIYSILWNPKHSDNPGRQDKFSHKCHQLFCAEAEGPAQSWKLLQPPPYDCVLIIKIL